MNLTELFMAVVLLIVAAQTTYLTIRAPRRWTNKTGRRKTFVDTSVLMDGRIIQVAQTHFISDELVIPRSVILELQLLADKSDHDKRERARYGLDVVAELQAIEGLKVSVMDDGKATDGVDERLLELARKFDGAVMTIDFNLNKVASTEKIPILNINELAQTLRMAHLPGEKMMLELVEKGQDSHQAVGYLPDGTMVVVEQASSLVGKAVTVECIRSLQTVAGKMMFARLVGADRTQSKPKIPRTQPKGRQKPVVQPAALPTPELEPSPSITAVHARSPEARPQRRQQPKPRQQSANQNRRRTSSDRENSLIDLVDKLS